MTETEGFVCPECHMTGPHHEPDCSRPVMTDAEIEQAVAKMRADMQRAEHWCPYCPVSVRTLYAVAHNAMLAIDMARAGVGEWDRAWRKFGELRETVLALEPLVAEHFNAVGFPDGGRPA